MEKQLKAQRFDSASNFFIINGLDSGIDLTLIIYFDVLIAFFLSDLFFIETGLVLLIIFLILST